MLEFADTFYGYHLARLRDLAAHVFSTSLMITSNHLKSNDT